MNWRMRRLVVAFTIGAPMLFGQSTLHMGFGAGTSCATGCSGEPNVSAGGAATLDIYQQSNGSKDVIGSGNLLLILAVPAGETVPLTGTEADTDPYPGGTTTTGAIDLTATKSNFSSGDLYSFLDLNFGNKSNSFVNISEAESTYAGVTVSSFTVYEYLIHSPLGPNGLADIGFQGDLPAGTFAVAYGCKTQDVLAATGCSGSGKTFNTPFTEADLVTPDAPTVPEPSAVLLLGTTMIGLGTLVRRRRSTPTE